MTENETYDKIKLIMDSFESGWNGGSEEQRKNIKKIWFDCKAKATKEIFDKRLSSDEMDEVDYWRMVEEEFEKELINE